MSTKKTCKYIKPGTFTDTVKTIPDLITSKTFTSKFYLSRFPVYLQNESSVFRDFGFFSWIFNDRIHATLQISQKKLLPCFIIFYANK